MFYTDLPKTIWNAKEHLESHAIMMQQHQSNGRHRGMQAPSKSVNLRIPNEIYNSMSKLMDRKLTSYQNREKRHKSNENRFASQQSGKRNERNCGRRAKNNSEEHEISSDNLSTSGKISHDSAVHPSIINFISLEAIPLPKPEQLLTANGTIYAIHSARLNVETTKGANLDSDCIVCTKTEENLVSVLDCAHGHDAVIFDNSHAYLVNKSHLQSL